MKPRVLLASCADLPESDGDDTALPAVLADVGVDADWVPWDERGAGFENADLVVLRCTWDYSRRRPEFLSWCDSVPTLANAAEVVRWNTDKAYMVELADRGVAAVPTQLVRPGERPEWPDAEFVLKPTVGAGSRGAARFTATDVDAAQGHLDELHGEGGSALLQPYQAAVDGAGETALVFFGGVYSHSFVKGPMLAAPSGTDTSGLFMGERLQPAQASPDLRRAAEDVLDASCALLRIQREDLLYTRVDLVRGPRGEPLLLELELTEPSLGFRNADAAAPSRFASAVRVALSRR